MNQIREMSPQERKEKLKQLRQELSRERGLISSGGSPENSGNIKQIKRTIARILTHGNLSKPMKTSVSVEVQTKTEVTNSVPVDTQKDIKSNRTSSATETDKGVIEKDD
jgi:large subunit ribosomal protein L29